MRRGARRRPFRGAGCVAAAVLLVAAACSSGSPVPDVPDDDAAGPVWTADLELERAWRVRYPSGREIGVTFGEEDGVDLVHVSVFASVPEGDAEQRGQTARLEVEGAAPEGPAGRTAEFLGWHLTEPEREFSLGEPVPVRYQRLFTLRADRAFGTPRLRPGASYRVSLVLTSGGPDERLPIAFRVPE